MIKDGRKRWKEKQIMRTTYSTLNKCYESSYVHTKNLWLKPTLVVLVLLVYFVLTGPILENQGMGVIFLKKGKKLLKRKTSKIFRLFQERKLIACENPHAVDG